MTTISYSQNREDVVLARAFGEQVRGFYVDVGAEHPELNSVTKYFYDLGWRGINIEPSAAALDLLEQARPQDINLGLGISDFEGKATFFEGPPENHGSSTFRTDLAQRYRRLGQVFTEVTDVPVSTLSLICEEYVGDRVIDFLKIDVEGLEPEVVAGADWERWRPRVVVVEATEPNLSTPSHQRWEPTLLCAGYVFALFDGVNRFYARADETDLLQALSSPACVLDDFVDAQHESDRRALLADRDAAVAALQQQLDEAHQLVTHHQGANSALQAEARRTVRAARLLEDRLNHALDEALRSELGAAALRDRLSEESARRIAAEHDAERDREARAEAEAELASLKATKTFRWTAQLRSVYRLFNRP